MFFMPDPDCRLRILKCSGLVMWCNAILLLLGCSDSRSWPEWNIILTVLSAIVMAGSGGFLMSFVWASSSDFPGLEMFINLGTRYT